MGLGSPVPTIEREVFMQDRRTIPEDLKDFPPTLDDGETRFHFPEDPAEVDEGKALTKHSAALLEKFGPDSWHYVKFLARSGTTEPEVIVVIHNTVRWELKRGRTLCVHISLLQLLDDGIVPDYNLVVPGDGKRSYMKVTKRFRFPYQWIQPCSKEEAAAWWRQKVGKPLPKVVGI